MLETFGSLAAAAMVLCYALEERGPGFTLAFAVSCAAAIAVRVRHRLVAVLRPRGGVGGRRRQARVPEAC